MNNEELKNALFSGCPVEHNGIEYKCVSAIIYRNKGGKLEISAEVADKKSNSVCIVGIEKLREVSNEEAF